MSFEIVSGRWGARPRQFIATMLVMLNAAVLAAGAQSLTLPPSGDNQKCAVIQNIGLVEVRVDYSSPDVHAPDGSVVTNDDWKETQQNEIEATGLTPANDLESAIITTLPSGPYTAIIHERNGASGIGLFEVYNLQNP